MPCIGTKSIELNQRLSMHPQVHMYVSLDGKQLTFHWTNLSLEQGVEMGNANFECMFD